MKQEAISPATVVRRCPNCGTRVAQNADTCYFCGHDLTKVPKSRRRITWIDLALVLAILLVVGVWWRTAKEPDDVSVDAAAPNVPVSEPADPTAVVDSSEVNFSGVDSSQEANQETDDVPVEVPTTIPTLAPAGNPFVVEHQVQPGETLVGIAERYGVTVEAIQAANDLDDILIRSGDELLIPVPEVVTEDGHEMTVPSVFNYTVQPGDTVVSIAIRFGTHVDAILRANGLGTDDFIRPDQTLVVPVDQVPAAVIASGDAVRGLPRSDQAPYEAPRLIGPQDNATIPATEDVLFRWISVDLLAPNEWYVLRVWPLQGTTEQPPTIWTKATSHRLASSWAPPGGEVRYGWQVTVVRVLPDEGNGREIQTASAPSEVRTFAWQ